jgi:hypothetical protein
MTAASEELMSFNKKKNEIKLSGIYTYVKVIRSAVLRNNFLKMFILLPLHV